MKVIVKMPGEKAEERDIENTLKALQDIVGGYIETLTLCKDMIIVCNEEGLINDMPFNCTVCGTQLFGPIIFVGFDGKEDFCDLQESARELVLCYFNN